MKTLVPTLALLLLCSSAATAHADVHVRIHCKAVDGKCPPPPPPPAPPAPPTAPSLPAPPAPPAPPPPPHIPAVPAAAHAACTGKATGATLTYTLRKGETMEGVCRSHDGRMAFELQAYDLDD